MLCSYISNPILLYSILSSCILTCPLVTISVSYSTLSDLLYPTLSYFTPSYPILLYFLIFSNVHLVKLINTDNSAVSKNHSPSFESSVSCENKFEVKCDKHVLQWPLFSQHVPSVTQLILTIPIPKAILYIPLTNLCRGLSWQLLWDPRQTNHDL